MASANFPPSRSPSPSMHPHTPVDPMDILGGMSDIPDDLLADVRRGLSQQSRPAAARPVDPRAFTDLTDVPDEALSDLGDQEALFKDLQERRSQQARLAARTAAFEAGVDDVEEYDIPQELLLENLTAARAQQQPEPSSREAPDSLSELHQKRKACAAAAEMRFKRAAKEESKLSSAPCSLSPLAGLPAEALAAPRVIQPIQNIDAFEEHHFSENTDLASLSTRRLECICGFFKINFLVPVIGDGNCFLHAAVAGLFSYIEHNPHKKERIIGILETFHQESDREYVLENTKPLSPDYDKGFNKDGDFNRVISGLKDRAVEELVTDNEFTSAFARVLRYALNHTCSEGDVSQRTNIDVDMSVVCALNEIFDVNAKLVVLEGKTDADQQGPSFFYTIQGNLEKAEHLLISGRKKDYPSEIYEADFLIICQRRHFFAGIK